MKHPIQPLIEEDGIIRFKQNKIVRFLLDAGPFDLNRLAMIPFTDEDREQFAQLIGYSLAGFGELDYVSDETYNRAELDYSKCPQCQQKAFAKGSCMACGLMEIIGDYEIIVDDPKKHIPWAIFAMTADAYEFLKKIQQERPEIKWKRMLLKDWYMQYEGEN